MKTQTLSYLQIKTLALSLVIISTIASGCAIVGAITGQEIAQAQKIWGDGVIAIGKVYSKGGNYKKAAENHVDRNYFFTPKEGKEVKVEYTFGYIKGKDGKLKINLHHSSLPYTKK
jgi:hypothetical protein